MSRLEKSLGYSFKDINRLETALSHLSYINGSGRPHLESNERLEFLGDSVLDLVVAEHLFQAYTGAREGELTRIKSSLVSREALAAQGTRLGLDSYILYARESVRGRQRGLNTIISNCLEAVIGAIYLDGGYEVVRRVILNVLLEGGQARPGVDDLLEAKNRLLHLSQVHYGAQPVYRIVEVSGPEHDKCFVCEVGVGGDILGRGAGANKKEAEKQAAQQALGLLIARHGDEMS
ncbi:ribonuclease III [bacterium]|nr:ribonuclease III [bacterium]